MLYITVHDAAFANMLTCLYGIYSIFFLIIFKTCVSSSATVISVNQRLRQSSTCTTDDVTPRHRGSVKDLQETSSASVTARPLHRNYASADIIHTQPVNKVLQKTTTVLTLHQFQCSLAVIQLKIDTTKCVATVRQSDMVLLLIWHTSTQSNNTAWQHTVL